MTGIKVLENKMSSIKRYLKILERYKNYSREDIEKNIDIRGAVERYLYLAIQSTIELAGAIISYKGFRKPTTMSDAFHILNEEEFISADLISRLAKMVGFRNIIAHDYEKIDYDIVYDVLQNKLKNIRIFTEEVARKLR